MAIYKCFVKEVLFIKIPRENIKIYDGTFDQKKYIQEYNKAKYDKLQLQFRKDEYMADLIKYAMAKRNMQSRTEYIKMAIEAQLKQDGIDIDKMRDMLQSVHNGDE